MTDPIVADSYGLLAIPADAPTLGEAVGDPALTKIASFLTACLLAYGQDAWISVAPGPSKASQVVNRTFVHDPDLVTFSEAFLPALFVWRVGASVLADARAQMAGVRIVSDGVRVLWVPPYVPQEKERRRLPMANAIVKIIDACIERCRVPAWVDPDDPDPRAPSRGSLFANRAGLWSISVRRSQTVPVAIEVEDGPTRHYQAVAIDLDIEENLERGGYPALGGVGGTITSPSDDAPAPIVTESFDFT